MKNQYFFIILLFAISFNNYGQSRTKSSGNKTQTLITNKSNVLSSPASPNVAITSCGSYIWPLTGQTFTSSGSFTSNGITQSFNNQTAWNASVNDFNSTVATNSLGGITNTNPIPLTVGSTTVSMGAPNGMYTTSTFVSLNTATDVLTITLSPGVYGFGATIFASDIADALIAGDITVTYSTGFVDARTVTSANEFFGYTSTVPITSITITCSNSGVPFKWPSIKNLSLATNPLATLDLTVQTPPVTTSYSVCQGSTVSGGLISNPSGLDALPNFSGNNTGGPTYNRPQVMNQGGTCANSGVGNAVQFSSHTFIAPTSGAYEFSSCGGATFDTFLALYEGTFNPSGLCAGNTLVESSDDVCGAQSTITCDLVGGTSYTLVVSGFGNTDAGSYTVTSTLPVLLAIEWYTAPTGGTMIGSGSPFNPVGVTGSSISNTNTVGTTTFYAQFSGETCRTPADFIINESPIINCSGNITACEGDTVNFTVTSNVSTDPVTLSQNTSSVAAAGAGQGCNPGGDNAYYRVYNLTALGYTSDLILNNIKFSVQSTAFDRVVTVSAYTLTGALTNENLTLLGSTTITATTSTSIINYIAAMGGLTVPGGSTLVISYAVASSTNNAFLPGANADGQSFPVFIKSADCGIPQPTSLAGIGFPNVHVILDAELTQAGSLVQTAGFPSGSVFPIGTTTVTYLATNTDGCEASCSFDVVVNPISSIPIGDVLQTILVSNINNATIASLVVSPSTIIWYPSLADAQAETNALSSSSIITNGSTYYAVNISGSCPSIPFAVTVTVALGTNEFTANNFYTLFPNPTTGIVTISNQDNLSIDKIEILDILGKTVSVKTDNTSQVDISNVAKGIYIFKIYSGETVFQKKIIKQ